jgi:type VI secretion system lysozyme-like protein
MEKIEVRMPLFDRLVDHDPTSRGEARPIRTLDRRGVRESIRRELELLFNTRCPFPAFRIAGRPRSVIDYGLPDFQSFAPRNFNDHGRLASAMREAVVAFEPRLANVRFTITTVPDDDMALAVHIEADMVVDNTFAPVSFVTTIKDGAASVR